MRWILVLAFLSLFLCCKKSSPFYCGLCGCLSYADTTCARYPDTATANQLITGKWYLREIVLPGFHNSPPYSTQLCDTSEYVMYFSDGTVIRKGLSSSYMVHDSSLYKLFPFHDTSGSNYFADKFLFEDSMGYTNYAPYYIPIQICNNVLIIGAFPFYPPQQPQFYIYSRQL